MLLALQVLESFVPSAGDHNLPLKHSDAQINYLLFVQY